MTRSRVTQRFLPWLLAAVALPLLGPMLSLTRLALAPARIRLSPDFHSN